LPSRFAVAWMAAESRTGRTLPPATLPDWPEHAGAFASKAHQWRETAVLIGAAPRTVGSLLR
jgi:hypothetical protein